MMKNNRQKLISAQLFLTLLLLPFLPVQALDITDRALEGTWYAPAADGQGFNFDVIVDPGSGGLRVVGSEYTFAPDNSGERRWYTYDGLVTGMSAQLTRIRSLGGLPFQIGAFDEEGQFYSDQFPFYQSSGSATLTLNANGTLTLVIDSADDTPDDTIVLRRLALSSPPQLTHAACERVDGYYHNLNAIGQGYFLDHAVSDSAQTVGLFNFTYENDGDNLNYYFIGEGNPAKQWIELAMYQTGSGLYHSSGQVINGNIVAGTPVSPLVGEGWLRQNYAGQLILRHRLSGQQQWHNQWLDGFSGAAAFGQAQFNDSFAANADSPYASVLKRCTLHPYQPCPLRDLPLLGQLHTNPDIEDIMDRVLVSDTWMATRMRQLLQKFPPQIRTLLKGVSAIIIDDDVRPSFYHSYTGAIYLDPRYLWLSLAEKQSICNESDYRSSFASQLQFRYFNRYVKDNGWAFASSSLDDNRERLFSQIIQPFARLLFHELAHANDFFPSNQHNYLNNRMQQQADFTLFQALDELQSARVSEQLWQQSPLHSEDLLQLGQVMYAGETANSVQTAYTAAQVGALFATDNASDMYAYSTPFEDLAMLFEATMMKYIYGLDHDIAFIVDSGQTPSSCDDYPVGWGVRNRIAEPAVAARAQWVAEQMLPQINWSSFFANLPNSQMMTPGLSWCNNLMLSTRLKRQELQQRLWEDQQPPHLSPFDDDFDLPPGLLKNSKLGL